MRWNKSEVWSGAALAFICGLLFASWAPGGDFDEFLGMACGLLFLTSALGMLVPLAWGGPLTEEQERGRRATTLHGTSFVILGAMWLNDNLWVKALLLMVALGCGAVATWKRPRAPFSPEPTARN